MAYVMATRRDDEAASGLFTTRRVDRLVGKLRPGAWKRLSCGDGAHGPRVYDWARILIRRGFGVDRRGWVLARRSISNPTEVAYYVCYGQRGTRLRELVRVAGARWAIEESFQTAKNEVGLDNYQVRRYGAWYAHITLAMAAAAFLDATVLQAVLTGWLHARLPAAPTTPAVPGRADRVVIAVDGKVLRAARLPEARQVHLLSAYDTATGIVLAQVAVAAKSSEIPAFAPLLAQVEGPPRLPDRHAHCGRRACTPRSATPTPWPPWVGSCWSR